MGNKKIIICGLILIFISQISFSQSLNIDSLKIQTKLKLVDERGLILKNKIILNNEGLLFEKIFEYEELKEIDLIKIIKNWGGETFVSFKDVLVNETDNQLVLRYNNNNINIYSPSYIRLVIDIKENKIRIRVYDEKLTYISIYFDSKLFTNNSNVCCVNSSGEIKNRHLNYIDTIMNLYFDLILKPYQLNEYVVKKSKNKKNEDW